MDNNKSIAIDFLIKYSNKIQPILDEFLDYHIEKSKDIGILPNEVVTKFKEMIKDGKKLRGALITLAYISLGGKYIDEIYDLSTFIEIFHTGILVHDDIMDNDKYRRGLPTIHTVFENRGEELQVKQEKRRYGESIGICLGDISFYMSWEKLLNSNIPNNLKIIIGKLFCQYSIRLVHGQEMDITITGAKNINEDDILKVLWIKSGEYTCLLPLKIGAILAEIKDDSKQMKALENYAKCLGWAFQIQDDILGIFGNEDVIGKPIGSDIKEGKHTLFM